MFCDDVVIQTICVPRLMHLGGGRDTLVDFCGCGSWLPQSLPWLVLCWRLCWCIGRVGAPRDLKHNTHLKLSNIWVEEYSCQAILAKREASSPYAHFPIARFSQPK